MILRSLLVGLAAVSTLTTLTVLLVFLITPAPWQDDAVFTFAGLPFALVGAFLVVRVPDNTVGPLLVIIGSAWMLGEGSRLYLWVSLHTTLPATDVAAWLLSWLFAPAWGLIALLVVVFPSGHVQSAWLRWPVRLYIPFVVLLTGGGMILPLSLDAYGDYLEGLTNPLAIEALGFIEQGALGTAVEVAIVVAVLGLALSASADLLLRWRRSRGIERLQIRTFALGVLAMILLFIIGALMAGFGTAGTAVENVVTTVALSAPPLAIGMAVLRYRLYDVDRIISRTLSYAALTAALAATYFALVVTLQALLRPLSDGSDLAIVVTTLIVAALFLPARSRMQRIVDRRFNRSAYNATQTVEAFNARLREQIDLDTLRYELLAVVGETMQPARASLWLRDRNDFGSR